MHRRCSGLPSLARAGAALAWFGLLFLPGCKGDPVAARGQRVAVQGKVTLDGQPLTGGAVQFHPILDNTSDLPASAFPPSTSELGDDGSFNLRTAGKAGAPVGKYHVQVVPGQNSDPEKWGRVPAAYTMQTSPLEVEVVENKSEGGYDIQLSSKDKPKVDMKENLAEKQRWRSKMKNKNKQ
jgi:hypothetical protein